MKTWLNWAYVAIMAAGTVPFLRWSRHPKGIPQVTYRLPIAILAWSVLWHVVAALGWDVADVADQPVHLARFADWLVTVPLLVTALALTATHALPDKRRRLTAVLAVVSILMILLALAAEASAPRTRLGFFAAGAVALIVTVVLILGPLWATAQRQPAEMAAHFRIAALLLAATWPVFPAIWLLGPPGFGLLGETGTAALFLALSVLVKLCWSLFDVGRLRTLSDRGEFVLTPSRAHPGG